jgi:hypothetical protein
MTVKANDRLFAALEQVRSQMHPELGADLVRDILDIELQFQDDPAEARQRVRQSVSQWAAAQVRSGSSS